jgi:hypothetical protein
MRYTLYVLSILLFMTGCASSGVSVTDSISIPRTIKVQKITGESAQFAEQFFRPFIDRGFRFGETDDPDAANLNLAFDPNVFHTEFDVSLLQGGRKILQSKASNSGWGTGINRSSALATLADNVVLNITQELSKMNISIRPDKSLTKVACENLFLDSRLHSLGAKVEINPDISAGFGFLANPEVVSIQDAKEIYVWADLQKQCLENKLVLAKQAGDDAKTDMLLEEFNQRQALLAALINKKLTFGEFSAKSNQLIAASARMKSEREGNSAASLEREKDRGATKTSDTQNNMLGTMNANKPTFTRCNRIGTQVFCNSY